MGEFLIIQIYYYVNEIVVGSCIFFVEVEDVVKIVDENSALDIIAFAETKLL